MSASIDIISLDFAKEYLHVADTGEDALLAALIDAASEQIERYTGRVFGSREITEFHDGGDPALVLRRLPVLSIGGIYDDPRREFGPGTLVPAASYAWDGPSGVIVLDGGSFAEGNRSVKVVYTAGYAAVPKDVQIACCRYVAALWERARRRNDGLRSETSDASALAYEEGMPSAVRELLDGYRVPVV